MIQFQLNDKLILSFFFIPVPPPVPVNVTIEERGTTWFYVRWVSLVDTPTHFIITATPTHGGAPLSHTVWTELSGNLTRLTPGTQYSVNVRASTTLLGAVATSEASDPIVYSTNTSGKQN